MSIQNWIILIVANVPLYWLVGWLVFRSWTEFWDCVKFWLTPDWFSLFRGEWLDDWWAEMKLGLWIVICAGAVFGESVLLTKWLH